MALDPKKKKQLVKKAEKKIKDHKLTEKYAKKNKGTTSKSLPPGSIRNTGKKIEKRRKLLQSI